MSSIAYSVTAFLLVAVRCSSCLRRRRRLLINIMGLVDGQRDTLSAVFVRLLGPLIYPANQNEQLHVYTLHAPMLFTHISAVHTHTSFPPWLPECVIVTR